MKKQKLPLIITLLWFSINYALAQRSWCSLEQSFGAEIHILTECPDTLINDTLITPLYANIFQVNLDTQTLYYSGSAGHIIEIDNVVYFRNYQGVNVLYNFNANLNDTLDVSYPQALPDNRYVVIQVDTVFMASKYRKRIFLQHVLYPFDRDIWVQGIGSTIFGFLSPGLSDGVTDWYSDALCFREHPSEDVYQIDTVWNRCYLELQEGNCETITSVNAHRKDDNFDVLLWQRENDLFFRSNIPVNRINIFDQFGRLVLERKTSDQKEFSVSCQDWPIGMYIVQLDSNTGEFKSETVMIFR